MTHALHELDDLEPLGTDLELELDEPEQQEQHLDDPPPRTRRDRARHDARTNRTATKDALCELVRDALGAKIGHDVDRLAVALDHLDNIAANLANLRATLAAEQTNQPRQDHQP
ncbi:hypothetical protein [Nocardioides sp.]|uniref:hypothetical protein n=1 Tax=Nocardioides sp. TaxID=35761 RepID=UPI0037841DA1